MTDLRKAAEMALEALGLYQSKMSVQMFDEAVAALRQALDDKPAVKTYCGGKPNYCTPEQERLGGEWVPCVKLPVIVHVRNQRDGEAYISTREGITPVLPDDLIMRGVAGEQYPIGRELFERTYTFDVDAVNMTQERVDETAKDRLVRIMGTFDLATGHADTLDQALDALEEELRDVLGHLRARQQQEPFIYVREDNERPFGGYEHCSEADAGAFPVYLAPPKRQWVGLTVKEARKFYEKYTNREELIYAIDEFLEEKNT